MHANAAGFSLFDSNLRAFHECANEALSNIDFNEGAYDVNFIRNSSDIDIENLIYTLGEYPEVWGQGNPEPKICINNIYVLPSEIQIMGAKQDTLKIQKNEISYMKFHANDMIEELQKCNEIKINVVGKANINNWMGNTSAQLFIEDYEVVDDLLSF